MLIAHRFQRAHAAFVARAPGFDALANPHFFLRQAFVEQRVLLFLVDQHGFLARQISRVVAGEVRQLAAIEFDDARSQTLQESPVMGDEQQSAVPVQQKFFDPGNGGDIEMVGGLVQQQQIRLGHQGARQHHAALHAAGQARDIHIRIQREFGQHRVHALRQRPTVDAFQRMLTFLQRIHQAVIIGHVVRQLVIAIDQFAGFAQAFRHHMKNAATRTQGHFLRQLRHA